MIDWLWQFTLSFGSLVCVHCEMIMSSYTFLQIHTYHAIIFLTTQLSSYCTSSWVHVNLAWGFTYICIQDVNFCAKSVLSTAFFLPQTLLYNLTFVPCIFGVNPRSITQNDWAYKSVAQYVNSMWLFLAVQACVLARKWPHAAKVWPHATSYGQAAILYGCVQPFSVTIFLLLPQG